MLHEVRSTLPIRTAATFRPRLRLMWPAPSTTANLEWDAAAHVYYLTEETRRYAAVVGCPPATDVSVMPYQEEPRDIANRFVIERSLEDVDRELVPIVITAAVDGRASAKATYDRILSSVRVLYEQTADHYE